MYIRTRVHLYMSQEQKRDLERTMRFRAFVVIGVLAWMLADVQMKHCGSNAHVQWFSQWKIRAIIMSLCDVMRISHAIEGGNYKKESVTKPWGLLLLLFGCLGTKC